MNVNPGMIVISVNEVLDTKGELHPVGTKWKVYGKEFGRWTLVSLDGKIRATGCSPGETFKSYGPLDALRGRLDDG